VPLVAALAICALALSAGGLLMRGAMDLLDREPLVQPRSLIEQVPAVSDRAPAPSGLSPAAVSAATQRSKSASTAGSNIAPEPLLVTGSEIDVFSPSFGPDGSLLFHRGRDRAALMRAWFGSEGVTEVKTLLEDGAANYHAVLSPDGERLAYDSDRDGTRAVYVARRDGGNPINVSGDGYAAVPRWAPDGRRLAFIRSEPSRPRVWNVWIANLESGSRTRVSRHSVGQAWSASWFPDGQRVAYTVEDRLVIVDLQTGRTQVVRSPVRGALLRTPAVSPRGDAVAFQLHRDGVWLFDVARGSMRRVMRDPHAEEFSWSPDGARLAYHSRRGGHWSLWQLTLQPS
jgi:Tol biopolymer transport system component